MLINFHSFSSYIDMKIGRFFYVHSVMACFLSFLWWWWWRKWKLNGTTFTATNPIEKTPNTKHKAYGHVRFFFKSWQRFLYNIQHTQIQAVFFGQKKPRVDYTIPTMTTDDDDDDDDTVSDNFISFSHIPYKTTCIQNSINKQSNKQEFAWRFLSISLTHTHSLSSENLGAPENPNQQT